MKVLKILLISAITIFTVSSAALSCEFGWTSDFNSQAKADPAGFRERLAERFDLSELHVVALRNIFYSPADAYIMLRFGEIKGGLKQLSKEQGIEAIKKYRSNKAKGWVALAGILGVETESGEFQDLIHGHDMHSHGRSYQVACSEYESGTVTVAANTIDKDGKVQAGFRN